MKFELTEVKSRQNDFIGSSFVAFDIHFLADGKPFKISMTYAYIEGFLKELDPAKHEYLIAIRKNIGGWGPKETEIVKITDEEEFDWLEAFKIFFNTPLGIESLEHHVTVFSKPLPPEELKKINKFIADIERPKSTTKYINEFELCEILENAMHQALIAKYPIAEKAEPEDFEALISIYIKTIINMRRDLGPLLHKIINQ